MDNPNPPLRLVATMDDATSRANRTRRLHELVQAFVEADDQTVHKAFWALMVYADPTLEPVPTRQPDTEGASHDRD